MTGRYLLRRFVLIVAAAGTEGAGLGAALSGVIGDLVLGAGERDTFSPRSWAAILVPATHSVSKFLARFKTTFALMWNIPDETPS